MSQPKRFTASSLREAYQKVRDELGGDAIIVSTRKMLAPGAVGEPARALIEVRARLAEPSDARSDSTKAHDLVRDMAEEAATGMPLDPAIELAPALLNRRVDRGKGVGASRAGDGRRRAAADAAFEIPVALLASDGSPAFASLAQRVDQISTLVEAIAMERMGERSKQSPGLHAAHEQLHEQDMSRAVASAVLARVESMLGRDVGREAGLRALADAVAALLPPPVSLAPAGEPRMLVLVGPAGAGKTTLAMRLAMDLRRRDLRVTVASTDVSRAGAPQQLEAMGAALGVPVRLCYAPDDAARLLAESASDLVIVDTAGHMGGRRDRHAELSAMLRSLPDRDVLLTLPATMRAADQRVAVEAFAPHGLTGLVFTRCDETDRLGAAAGTAIEAALGVAFTTHSDQVTEAPRPGDTRSLASAVATGRWAAADAAMPARRALARAS
ncbi:MAG: hypothetical protein EPO16_05310 [Dehalococcoidia bacterium]|nr:MAG: hypothetical protein EPO16_05310 [Dehalococcoidia bacterium]